MVAIDESSRFLRNELDERGCLDGLELILLFRWYQEGCITSEIQDGLCVYVDMMPVKPR